MEYTGCDDCIHVEIWSRDEPCCLCKHCDGVGNVEHFIPKISILSINAKLDKIMEKLGI